MTLHWFVHPQWFDDLGGWTEAKNIRHFVEWAELAFKHFGKLLQHDVAVVPLVHQIAQTCRYLGA